MTREVRDLSSANGPRLSHYEPPPASAIWSRSKGLNSGDGAQGPGPSLTSHTARASSTAGTA